jgi:tRNA pseudouridine32 synthase/23S rRNA pseudouridine746 synthase
MISIKDGYKSGRLLLVLLLVSITFVTASAETSHINVGGFPPRKQASIMPIAFLPLHRPKRKRNELGSSASIHCDIPILFESDRLLVVNKPSGIPHHDDDDQNPGMVTRLRLAHNQNHNQQQNKSQSQRLYGVHRLDRVTSGILLLAKDAEMAAELSQAFREGAVSKYYVGISGKKPSKKKQGLVQGYMERSRQKSWILTRGDQERSGSSSGSSSMAKTRFFTAGVSPMNEEFGLKSDLVGVVPKTCLLFRPYTGKTHQLRVAAKSVGLPLLGDAIYRDGGGGGGTKNHQNQNHPHTSTSTSTSTSSTRIRTLLHATAIHVELKDGPLTIWSPPPFADLLWQAEDASLEPVLETLMEKHCDVPAILEAMKLSLQKQAASAA